MEEATGAPSSFTVWDPKRLRASGRDGETVMTEPPSPLRMLLSRHTKRREFITFLSGAAVAVVAVPRVVAGPDYPNRSVTLIVNFPPGGSTDAMARIIREP